MLENSGRKLKQSNKVYHKRRAFATYSFVHFQGKQGQNRCSLKKWKNCINNTLSWLIYVTLNKMLHEFFKNRDYSCTLWIGSPLVLKKMC